MSQIKNGGLDQYGAGPFELQQFGTAGVEGVNMYTIFVNKAVSSFEIDHLCVCVCVQQNSTLLSD